LIVEDRRFNHLEASRLENTTQLLFIEINRQIAHENRGRLKLIFLRFILGLGLAVRVVVASTLEVISTLVVVAV